MSSPHIILIDIETSPNLGFTWEKWEQNVIAFKKEWQLLSFAWKTLGKPPTRCLARPDFKDKTDRSLVKAVWEILNAADIIIAHNGDQFDVPKLRAKFVEHGLTPPTPFKTIDTRKIAKQHFKFNSNSLNDLAATLKIGRKLQTGGFELWLGCMNDDPRAWRKMRQYNKHDVVLLEKVYQRLKAWSPSHPNTALYNNRPGCPVCSSPKIQRRGYQIMRTRKAARFQCQSCSHWFSRSLSTVARKERCK